MSLFLWRINDLYRKMLVQNQIGYIVCITDKHRWCTCTYEMHRFARCEFTISAYGAHRGADKSIREISTLASSPANYRRRIYGVIPLSRLALAETFVHVTQEMATDERWRLTSVRLFRTTVTSSRRDDISRGRFYSTWIPGNATVILVLQKTTDGFMIYPYIRRGLHIYERRSFRLWRRTIASRITGK